MGLHTENIVALGRKGQGKSYLIGYLMEQRLGKPFIIADYGMEHLGFSKAHSNVVLVPVRQDALGRIKWRELVEDYYGIVAYPYKITDLEFTDEVDKLMNAVMDVENHRVVIEEVHNLAPTQGIRPGFARVVSQGRKHRIDIIAASLRPADVSKALLAQADEFFLFNITEPNALEYLRRCGLPIHDLPQLQRRVAIHYAPQRDIYRKVTAGRRGVPHYG